MTPYDGGIGGSDGDVSWRLVVRESGGILVKSSEVIFNIWHRVEILWLVAGETEESVWQKSGRLADRAGCHLLIGRISCHPLRFLLKRYWQQLEQFRFSTFVGCRFFLCFSTSWLKWRRALLWQEPSPTSACNSMRLTMHISIKSGQTEEKV